MVKIRSLEVIVEKWERVTPARRADYEAGVKDPKKDWESETKAAESRWEEGVRNAIGEKRFGRGVAKAGFAKWQKAAVEKGVRRWPEGIKFGVPLYREGFGPYRDVIEALTLPERFFTGDPRNIERVAKLAAALHEKKIRG